MYFGSAFWCAGGCSANRRSPARPSMIGGQGATTGVFTLVSQAACGDAGIRRATVWCGFWGMPPADRNRNRAERHDRRRFSRTARAAPLLRIWWRRLASIPGTERRRRERSVLRAQVTKDSLKTLGVNGIGRTFAPGIRAGASTAHVQPKHLAQALGGDPNAGAGVSTWTVARFAGVMPSRLSVAPGTM